MSARTLFPRLHPLLLGLAAASLLTACITEEDDPQDAAPAADQAVLPDGGIDAGSACEGPNPSIPVCTEDADCAGDARCVQVEGCASSACDCDEATGTWLCTADCGPLMGCVELPPACGNDEVFNGNECAPKCYGDDTCPAGQSCNADTVCLSDPDCPMCAVCVGWCSPIPLCEGPDPSQPTCTEDAQCPADHACLPDPQACRPSSCGCDAESGGWWCTDDCGPDNHCVPRSAACADDFECVDGACVNGACQRVCQGDGEPALCDAIPPVCGIGETLVTTGGCYGCVDARTCGDVARGECWGAWLDETGTCRAPNDGAYPAECCTLPGQTMLFGLTRPGCAPHDGPATELLLGVDLFGCDARPAAHLRIVFWADLPEGEVIDLSPGQFPGELEICTAPGACAPPASGRLLLLPAPFHAHQGRVEFTLGDGTVIRSAFSTDHCPSLGNCG